jgi:hypothetical protein
MWTLQRLNHDGTNKRNGTNDDLRTFELDLPNCHHFGFLEKGDATVPVHS